MKRTLISMLMIASCFGVANAQLMVDQNGKVAVGIEEAQNLLPQLTVETTGQNDVAMSINTQNLTGLQINRTGYNTSTVHYGMYVSNEPFGVESYGVYGRSVKSNLDISNRIYGIAGVAGGSNLGFNFGVAGFLSDSYGAGIFGSSVSSLGNIGMPEAFAGFFHGNVCITGSLNASNVITLSDYRLKSDIKSISGSCLDKVLDMNIVEFKYKQREFEVAEGTEVSKEKRAPWYDEESAFMKNKHYGFIAQELQKIYPDLVVEGKDGYLGVNYLEIIPLLVRSIQELNAKVEQYENGNAPIMKAQARNTDVTDIDAVVTTLYQNTPNPFTESTLIRCDVANDVVKADLYIYNMNGEQITEYAVTERGKTSITIDGGILNAGMYLYALIADGQVIDTKRMILTK